MWRHYAKYVNHAIQMSGYSLHVKSYNKKHTNVIHTKRGDMLAATRGSSYCLIADNKTDRRTSVTISIGGVCVGTWNVPPRSKLTIENSKEAKYTKTVSGSDAFVFGMQNDKETLDYDPYVCEMYEITAEFEPAGFIVCVPVHICEHDVNTHI